MVTIKATIFLDKQFWVGLFERTDKEGYSVARHIFGGEPSDQEVHDFVLNEYISLQFGEPQEFTLKIKRMNPKRLQREVRREMERFKETSKPSTHAREVLREELEKSKIVRKSLSKKEKDAHKQEQFEMRQAKKKQKHRGH